MMDGILSDVSDWANISGDILRCIADMTLSVKDRVRMTAVCHPWRSSLKGQKLNFPVCLMQAEIDESDKHCFYNTLEEIFIELDLPEIRGKRCWGSPFGWLVTEGFDDVEFQLFNPLSRARIPLPSQSTQRNLPDTLEKLILLTSPDDSDSDCIVMAIYFGPDCLLAFAKLGDEAWTVMGDIRCVDDVIYFKGNIYACTHAGEIFLCQDLDGAHPKAVKFAPEPNACVIAKKYLFDLDGNFCMASRNIVSLITVIGNPPSACTDKFVIFKLDMQTSVWEKIYSLGDNSLFLGNCTTFAIAAADYPGCRPNSIYLSDDHHVNCNADRTYGDRGGIYDCKNLTLYLDSMSNVGFVEPFPKSNSMQHVIRSLWIIPYSR